MPINLRYRAPFLSDECYHVTARAVGNQLLFLSDDHREFLLYRYRTMLRDYVFTLAYALMDNHIHWMIRVRSPESLKAALVQKRPALLKNHQRRFLKGELDFSRALELQFKDFFISYAMIFNQQYDRKGALFINPFRRVLIKDRSHFTQLIAYIHCNPVKHLGKVDYTVYAWSSYREILSGKNTFIEREAVLNWFGGAHAFRSFHFEQAKFYQTKGYERLKA